MRATAAHANDDTDQHQTGDARNGTRSCRREITTRLPLTAGFLLHVVPGDTSPRLRLVACALLA